MPFAIDEDKINSSDIKVMDILKPPMKSIPYQPYPKMVFLHPKDKTKEHLTKVVQNEVERDAALAQGYRLNPHVPAAPPVDLSGFEADVPEDVHVEAKRGPGRPPRNQEMV